MKKKKLISIIIVGFLLTIICIYWCVMNASFQGRNIIFMIDATRQLKTDSDGIVKIDKETYLTKANEDIANLFKDKDYEVTVFFTQCEYRKKGKENMKCIYGEMYTGKYIIWTISDYDLQEFK